VGLSHFNRFYFLFKMKKNLAIYSFFLLSCFQLLTAQEKNDSIYLSAVEVNANRTKIYSELGRVLTVVNQEQITRSAARSLDELLDYVSGLDVRQRGANGVQADISVRGGSFDQVLVLLNGVNITDPQTGHYNLDIPLNLSDVTRIEILQGSSARVLGPNAFSGAINIVTESLESKTVNAELVGGSFGYFAQAVSGNFGNDRFHTFASVSHQSSDGYMPNTDFNMFNAFSQSIIKTAHAGKFDLQLAVQQKSFGANSFYSLDYPNQFEHTKTFLTALSWTLSKGKMTYAAQAYWRQHHDRFELFRDSRGAASWYKGHNYHLTDVTGGKASAAYQSSWGKSTVGVDIRNEHIYSNVLGASMDSLAVPFEKNVFFTREANRSLFTAFVDHSIALNHWYISLGADSTQSEDFGQNTYGGIDLAYAFNDEARVFLSANSAIRLPTFTDLYYKSATQISNPDLQPEKSTTLELGTKIQQVHWKLDASVYYRVGKNIIDWVKVPDSVKWESRNLTSVNALGTDLTFEYSFKKSFFDKISVSYSYLHLDKSADEYDSKYALDYLKHKVVLTINHRIWNKLSASWKASYFDRAGNYSDLTSQQKVDYTPCFLLDGRLLWSQKRFDIFADVNNILNKSYADFGGLAQPGVNANVGFRLKLN